MHLLAVLSFPMTRSSFDRAVDLLSQSLALETQFVVFVSKFLEGKKRNLTNLTTTNSYQGFGKLTANHLMQDLEGQRLWQGGTKAVFLLFYVRSFKLHVFYRCAPVSTEVNDQQASHQSRSHDFPFRLSSHLMSEYDSRWPLM